MSLKVGITGNKGFTGRHLTNYLKLKNDIEIVPFEKNWMEQPDDLRRFVAQCDTIVHLAAVNRSEDASILHQTNIQLVERLIHACVAENATPHILFASSAQETLDNLYGQSKKMGRELLEKWATETGAITTGMVIPNVFGPFGRPYYNSVVATFCHQISRGETPVIVQDNTVHLIYINDLTDAIYQLITQKTSGRQVIAAPFSIKVSDLLSLLKDFKTTYMDNGAFPDLSTPLQLALFNTFRCYVPHEHYPAPFTLHTDNRGSFVEVARTGSSGQFSFSTTVPGITRGNHYHTRKAERFAVIRGKARIALRRVDETDVIEYFLDGNKPAFVDMPIWHTHNITNVGEEELLTLFWINEPYNPEDPDTFFVNVDESC